MPEFSEHIGVLSKEQCDWIKSLCTEFKVSEITYDNNDNSRNINQYFRNSKTCMVELTDDSREKLLSMVRFIGVESLPIKREIQLLEYSEGGFFKRHKDGPKRYKTLIIQLSDENDYTGGELYVEDQPTSKKQGSLIIFDSNTYHQLHEVTSGKRYVLVVWLLKEHFENPKTVI